MSFGRRRESRRWTGRPVMLGRRGGEADPENGMVVLVDGPLGTDAGETGPVEGIGDHGGEEHLVS